MQDLLEDGLNKLMSRANANEFLQSRLWFPSSLKFSIPMFFAINKDLYAPTWRARWTSESMSS